MSNIGTANSNFVFIDYNSLRNDLNEIFKSIRKDLCDEFGIDFSEAVCGLCQFYGDSSCGESGDSIIECPGFDKDDCFELKVYFLEKYMKGVKQMSNINERADEIFKKLKDGSLESNAKQRTMLQGMNMLMQKITKNFDNKSFTVSELIEMSNVVYCDIMENYCDDSYD